jgi:hypothetical protein
VVRFTALDLGTFWQEFETCVKSHRCVCACLLNFVPGHSLAQDCWNVKARGWARRTCTWRASASATRTDERAQKLFLKFVPWKMTHNPDTHTAPPEITLKKNHQRQKGTNHFLVCSVVISLSFPWSIYVSSSHPSKCIIINDHLPVFCHWFVFLTKHYSGTILPCSGLLQGVGWFETDVSELHIGRIFG